jgi:hypothetical protein
VHPSCQTLGVMKLVIDSNRLQSDELQNYLLRSTGNVAVLCDFAAMEAYKGDTLISIYKSMQVVSAFPRQILILKGSRLVSGLRGRRSGLQRRLIDEQQTEDFHIFATAMVNGKGASTRIDQQLIEHGVAAKTHLNQMLNDASDMRPVFDVLTKLYAKEELALIRAGAEYTQAMVDKLVSTLLEISALIFSNTGLVRHRPSPEELPNTFLFRVALCCYLMAIRRGALGGAAAAKAERVRNDMVDMIFVAYGTYFDGLMSADTNVNRIYDEACVMLSALFKAEVPRLAALQRK